MIYRINYVMRVCVPGGDHMTSQPTSFGAFYKSILWQTTTPGWVTRKRILYETIDLLKTRLSNEFRSIVHTSTSLLGSILWFSDK